MNNINLHLTERQLEVVIMSLSLLANTPEFEEKDKKDAFQAMDVAMGLQDIHNKFKNGK